MNRQFPEEGIQMANMYIKRCCTLLIIKGMQIKAIIKCYLTPVRMAIIKKTRDDKYWWICGGKETLVHRWWEHTLIQSLWKTIWKFLKKLKVELPYNSAVLPLGIYLKKTKTLIWKDICILRFISVLLIMTKI